MTRTVVQTVVKSIPFRTNLVTNSAKSALVPLDIAITPLRPLLLSLF
jgi:hypothetical protein